MGGVFTGPDAASGSHRWLGTFDRSDELVHHARHKRLRRREELAARIREMEPLREVRLREWPPAHGGAPGLWDVDDGALETMKIAGKEITYEDRPLFVAEISCNHMGSLSNALHLIELARSGRADFVKFQCYEPSDLTLPGAYRITRGPWQNRDLWELYNEAQTPYDWFPRLAEQCRECDMPWFSSVFNVRGIDVLEKAGCHAYKIASCELTDLDLIRNVAATGKPVILSTGMADIDDIRRALTACARSSTSEPILFHCIAGYPSRVAEAQLRSISVLKRYAHLVGVSDHCKNVGPAVAATVLGVCMIEKHLRMAFDHKTRASLDADHSLNAEQFYDMVRTCTEVWDAMYSLGYRARYRAPAALLVGAPRHQGRRAVHETQCRRVAS
jgi:sialic acid synthase SpsE